jgi:hypothetical protein
MQFTTQSKVDWKFLSIAIIPVVVVGVGFLWQNFETQKPVGCTTEAKICPDGSAVGRTSPNCEFAECPVAIEEAAGLETYDGEGTTTANSGTTLNKEPLIKQEFSYPYPFSFEEKNEYNPYYFKFDLTKVTFGEKTIGNFHSYNQQYQAGQKINALTLYFKIIQPFYYGVSICLRNNFRLELNEEGDMKEPVNDSFNGDCFAVNQTYYDQEVIFSVPESQKVFSITTGGQSKIFFTVTILDDNTIKVDK